MFLSAIVRLSLDYFTLYQPEFNEALESIYETGENKSIYDLNQWNIYVPIPDGIDNSIEEILLSSQLSDEQKKQFRQYLGSVLSYKRYFHCYTDIQHKLGVLTRAQEKRPDMWQFVPFRFVTMASELAKPLNEFVNDSLKNDAEKGIGFFENKTIENRLDEDIDDFLDVEAYDLTCSFEPFYKELHKYNVDSLLGKEALTLLFKTLKTLSTSLKANTSRPNFASNRILDAITEFDKLPLWGIIFQILILQGMCRLLECCTLTEKDKGFAESTSLYNWLQELLSQKLIRFIYFPIGENDKILIRPLCEYLYSTEIGEIVQECIFSENKDEVAEICSELDAQNSLKENDEQPVIGINSYPILNTDRARKFIKIAINKNFVCIEKNHYQWTFGNKHGAKARLAYFLERLLCPKPTDTINAEELRQLEKAFNVNRLDRAIQQNADTGKQSSVRKWRAIIDNLFDE